MCVDLPGRVRTIPLIVGSTLGRSPVPRSGPQFKPRDAHGHSIAGGRSRSPNSTAPIWATGDIKALKGLGGYHLVCRRRQQPRRRRRTANVASTATRSRSRSWSPTSTAALAAFRRRRGRGAFAAGESPGRPIVLLHSALIVKLPVIADAVAPGNPSARRHAPVRASPSPRRPASRKNTGPPGVDDERQPGPTTRSPPTTTRRSNGFEALRKMGS